jgi:hypothetical protein
MAASQGTRQAIFRDGTGPAGEGFAQAGAPSLEAANQHLEPRYLPWWNELLTLKPCGQVDAHRSLVKSID